MDQVSAVEDNRGWRTETRYDAFGRVSELLEGLADELTRTELRVVNALGEVVEVHDARASVTRMTYDGRGLLTAVQLPALDDEDPDEDPAVEQRVYNAAGHLERVTDPDGVVVAYEVDAMGRVLAEVLAPETAEEARTRYAYDAMGRLAEVVRPLHQESEVARRMEWDAFGRLSQVVDEAGHATHYLWNDRDQLAQVWEGAVDGVGVVTSRYDYTALGHLTRHAQWRNLPGTPPVLETQWLDHSPEGLVGRIRTARGEETLTYDAVGRPETSTVSALPGVESPTWAELTRTWAYNDFGGEVVRTEVSVDALGGEVEDRTRRVFDERGWLRVEEETRPEGALSVTFDYDANGNRIEQRTEGVGAGEATQWTWDSRNRMEAVTTPGGESRWTYSPGGRPERIDYANETRAEFGYTAGARRLASVVHREGVAPGADVMAAAQYTYDVNGNRLSQVLSIAGVTETTTYTYDVLDQLRSFSVLPGAGAPPGAEPRHTWYGHERYRRVYEGRCRGGASLVEDDTVPTGLRCAAGGLQTVASALTYEGPHGQISRIENPLAVHSAGEGVAVVEYEHDFAGNLVERRTQVGTDASGDPIEEVDLFRYDALNRLVETARGPPGAAQLLGRYGYNADGLRTRVRESDRNADAWYDGLALLVERVEEDGGGENDPWMNTVRYHHDPGGLHAITAAHDGAGFGRSTHFAHRDAMGSTLAVSRPDLGSAGGAGMIAASWRTDPWGLVTAETGVGHVNASVFTGHQHDFATGLIYMRARHYDPALGQFLTA
ncbi:MAG: RHS repeat protein, partial [Balneolales bacterium]|nr:RHS repeat protein [Balneolales bacterium]